MANYYDSRFYSSADFCEYYHTSPSYATSSDIVPFQDSVPCSSYYDDDDDEEFSEPGFYEHYNPTSYDDPFTTYLGINHSMYQTTPSYPTSYDIVPFQDSVSYDEFSETGFYEHYNPTSSYDPFTTHLGINRSIYQASEPLRIEYNPISYCTANQFSSDTHYTVSYSTAKAEVVDDTHYEDYDPTPYDGGYDPTMTYGKPLPPSIEICHPRSSPVPGHSLLPDKVDYSLIPSPYDKDELPSKPEPIKSSEAQKQEPDPDPDPDQGIGDSEALKQEPEPGAGDGYGVGVREEATQVPYGSGLEAMDICDTLFGYWPCLDKYKRMKKEQQGVAIEDEQEKLWRCAADYLFGTPSGGGGGGNNYWEPNYNYERHYQRQDHKHVEDYSWLINSTVYSQEHGGASSFASSSW